MWYFVALFALFIVGIFDGHTSSLAAMLLIFLLGFWSVNSIKSQSGRVNGSKVFGIVFSVYVFSAFFASRSFLNGQYFYVSDAMKYIAYFSNINKWSLDAAILTLEKQYIFFDDNNGLYNESLALWAYIANHYLDGTSEFFLTLFQALFGVLAILEFYKILSLYFNSSKAAKYTWLFALLSLFHIYSIVIIRDIVIAYFYMLGLRKIIGKPQILNIVTLLLVMIITMGVRIYTGLFFGAFIMFWLYKLVQDTKYAKYKIVLLPIILFGLFFVGASLASSAFIDDTTSGVEHEMEHYDELYTAGNGASNRMRSLPVGVRHIVVLFFSQLPLTSSHFIMVSNNFSNLYISFLNIINPIFGFVVFYGLMYYCFVKGLFKKMNFNEKWILIIMLIFMAMTLGTHIDVRRSMEAVPIYFLFYLLLARKYDPQKWSIVNRNLILIGCFITLAYMIIK